jgi:AAA domain/TrwC relaxase
VIRAKSLTIDVHGGPRGLAELDKAARYYADLADEAALYYQGSADVITKGEIAERPTIVVGEVGVVEGMGLSLGGPPTLEQMKLLALGKHAESGDALTHLMDGRKHVGWTDTVYSPNKSWSLTVAAYRVAGREAEAQAMIDDLIASVEAGVRQAQDVLNLGRRMTDGVRIGVPAKAVTLVDVHGGARPVVGEDGDVMAPDASFHAHVRWLNLARLPDGSWSSLNIWELVSRSPAFNAAIDAELRRRTSARGLATTERVHGDRHEWTSWEVSSVPVELRDAHSKRADLVDAIVADREEARRATLLAQRQAEASASGQAPSAELSATDVARCRLSPKARALISARSRSPKGLASRAQLADEWRKDFDRYDFTAPPPGLPSLAPTEKAIADGIARLVEDALTAEDGIAETHSVWSREEAWEWLASEAVGRQLSAVDIATALGQLEARSVALDDPLGGSVWTTETEIKRETETVRFAFHGAGEIGASVPVAIGEAAVTRCETANGRPLAADQRAVFDALTSPVRFQILIGPAGSSKTTALQPCVASWTSAGYRVLGLSTSNAAAQILGKETGCLATSFADLFTRLTNKVPVFADGSPLLVDHHTILLVDEVGLASVKELHTMTQLAESRHCAKVVLSGDYQQLSPIHSGGLLRYLCKHITPAQLHKNYRQLAAPHEQEVSALLREGKGKEALESKARAGLLHICNERDLAIEAAVADYGDDVQYPMDARTHVLLAGTNATVEGANRAARQLFRNKGWLGEEEVVIAVGDELNDTAPKRGRPKAPPRSLRLSVGDRVALQETHKERVPKMNADGMIARKRDGSVRMTVRKTPRRTRGTVSSVRSDSFGQATVQFMTDPDHFGHSETVALAHDELRNGRIDHCYSQTLHTSQGGTWERAYILQERGKVANTRSAYVGQTRSRKVSAWYMWRKGDDETNEQAIAEMAQAISRDQREHVALEYLSPDARADILDQARSQQQAISINAITAHTPMTKGQEAMLRDFGVVPERWTWLYASARLDMLQGYPVPGTTAEAWLRDHGSTAHQATALVTQALQQGGHDLEGLLRTATAEQRAVADRHVARVVMDAQHRQTFSETEIADLRARSVLRQLMAASSATDEDVATVSRRRRADDRTEGLRRT